MSDKKRIKKLKEKIEVLEGQVIDWKEKCRIMNDELTEILDDRLQG